MAVAASMRRAVALAVACVSIMGGLTAASTPSADAQLIEELFRPPGLDADWPSCVRSEGFGIDSVGCAVNDVPGGRANAHNYSFLHGRAYRSTGEEISNLNARSPFGQQDTLGDVIVPDGTVVGTMASGNGGWWGVWVPTHFGGNPDNDPVPPVRARIRPRIGYWDLYRWQDHTTPANAPPGGFSDDIGLAGGDAIRVDDLVMPGPPQITQSSCTQVGYGADGGSVRCTGAVRHLISGGAAEFEWTWPDGTTVTGPSVERTFADDGVYRASLEATAPDGWVVRSRNIEFVVGECAAIPCLEASWLDPGIAPEVGEAFDVTYTVENLGTVDLTAVTLDVSHLSSGLLLRSEVPVLPVLAVGASAPLTVTLQGDVAGVGELGRTATATLPSGAATSGALHVETFEIGSGDLAVGLEVPTPLAPRQTVTAQAVVTNHGDEPITDIVVYVESLDPAVAEVVTSQLDGVPVLEPGATARVDLQVWTVTSGTARLAADALGSRGDDSFSDRSVTVVEVGAPFEVTLDAPDEVRVGEPFELVATVTNRAPADGPWADEVMPVPELPEVTPSDLAPDVVLTSGTMPLYLEPGQSDRWIYEVTAVAAEEHTFTLHVQGEVDGGPVATEAALTVEVVGQSGFVVTSVDDSADATLDGRCDVDADAPGDQCTLRAAIEESNAGAGGGTVTFQTPTARIVLDAALPTITRPLHLDGTTVAGGRIVLDGSQLGSAAAGLHVAAAQTTISRVVVGGFDTGIVWTGDGGALVDSYIGVDATGEAAFANGRGLTIEGNDNTVERCVISASNASITGDGVLVLGARNRLLSNIIGLSASERLELGNRRHGIAISGGDGTVVGAAGAGNVIGANDNSGIYVYIGGNGLRVQGNAIGVDRTYTNLLAGNASNGIALTSLEAHGVVIGGPNPGDANVIVQNDRWGMYVVTPGVVIQGNWIGSPPGVALPRAFYNEYGGVVLGATASGARIVDNHFGANLFVVSLGIVGAQDVEIQRNRFDYASKALQIDSGSVLVGGSPADGNVFADGFIGVIGDQAHVQILGNVLADVETGVGPAIDLGERMAGNPHYDPLSGFIEVATAARGVTVNDPTDADVGPNGLQNHPTLVARRDGGTLHLTGTLDGATVGTPYTIEVFASRGCSSSGHGPAESFVGRVIATRAGAAALSFSLQTTMPDPAFRYFTTTATGPGGTSELSACTPLGTGTSVSSAAPAGTRRVEVASNDGFAVGDVVAVNPGGATAEMAVITGFGSLVLDRPLRFDHAAGEVVTVLTDPPDLAPWCDGVQRSTPEDVGLSVAVPCSDEDVPGLRYATTGVVPPGVVVAPSGAVSYVPPANFHGEVTVAVVATDAAGQASPPALVRITVTPVGDAPVCAARSASATVGQEVSIAPSCTDVDGDALTYVIASPPAGGTAVVRSAVLAYTPSRAGADTFTYAASDGTVTSAPATVTVTSTAAASRGLTVHVTRAAFVVNPRLPAAFALAGSIRPVPGASIACGEPVTLSVNGGLWAQTLPGSAFRTIAGQCVQVQFPRSTLLAALTLDLRRGTWAAAGLGQPGALRGLANPVTVTLTIGDDTGSATVTASILR
jgi:hypothetical protein